MVHSTQRRPRRPSALAFPTAVETTKTEVGSLVAEQVQPEKSCQECSVSVRHDRLISAVPTDRLVGPADVWPCGFNDGEVAGVDGTKCADRCQARWTLRRVVSVMLRLQRSVPCSPRSPSSSQCATGACLIVLRITTCAPDLPSWVVQRRCAHVTNESHDPQLREK